jgi:sRNA-binding carbon storage regulator CsrA
VTPRLVVHANDLAAGPATVCSTTCAMYSVNVEADSLTMALVITRGPGEQLILTTPAGERIVIEAEPAPVKGLDAVKLVIDAARTVQVLRGELERRRR